MAYAAITGATSCGIGIALRSSAVQENIVPTGRRTERLKLSQSLQKFFPNQKT